MKYGKRNLCLEQSAVCTKSSLFQLAYVFNVYINLYIYHLLCLYEFYCCCIKTTNYRYLTKLCLIMEVEDDTSMFENENSYVYNKICFNIGINTLNIRRGLKIKV